MENEYKAKELQGEDVTATEGAFPEITNPEYFRLQASLGYLADQNEELIALRLEARELKATIKQQEEQLEQVQQELFTLKEDAGSEDEDAEPRAKAGQQVRMAMMEQIKLSNLEKRLGNIKGVSKAHIQDIFEAIFSDINHCIKYVNEKEERFLYKEQLLVSQERMLQEL